MLLFQVHRRLRERRGRAHEQEMMEIVEAGPHFNWHHNYEQRQREQRIRAVAQSAGFDGNGELLPRFFARYYFCMPASAVCQVGTDTYARPLLKNRQNMLTLGLYLLSRSDYQRGHSSCG